MTQRIVVIGGGGFGREVLELIADMNAAKSRPSVTVIGVLDDGEPELHLLTALGVRHLGPVDAFVDIADDVGYAIGIGGCAAKQRIDELCTGWGREPVTLIHPTAVVGRTVSLGAGAIVCAQATITTNVRTGHHVHVNPGASIGHDSVVGDHSTLTPQVAVAGHVTIGKRVFVGTGAVIAPEVHVDDGALVGAGAVVVRDVAAGETVAGVPARPMSR